MDEITHNHPPLCCCPDPRPRTGYRPLICPLCPEHGELAQLSKRRTD